MLAAPMARLQEKKQAAVTTGSTGIIRPSLREGLYGLYVLSPGTGSLAPVTHPRHAASLASAPGCQDHTISPSVPACARLAQPSRPSQPASTYRDDAYAPPREAGWRHQNMISEKTKQIYFSRSVLTRRMRLMPWTKLGARRNRRPMKHRQLRGLVHLLATAAPESRATEVGFGNERRTTACSAWLQSRECRTSPQLQWRGQWSRSRHLSQAASPRSP